MREQLIQYVNLMFAGAPDSEEVRAEILQNTLDRYDDLIAQGKSPEAAYRLAISGIGDINEILGNPAPVLNAPQAETVKTAVHEEVEDNRSKILRAVAIALYIVCPLPLFTFMDEIGLCLLLVIVAIATALMIITAKKTPGRKDADAEAEYSAHRQLRKSVRSLIWSIGVALYFIISFATGAWYITWVMFPIIGSIQGLVTACMDLKEVK